MPMQLEIVFEELPIGTDLGFEYGLLNGEAVINYHYDGEWSVHSISLDGYRKRSAEELLALDCAALPRGKTPPTTYERGQVNIDRQASPWLYNAIVDQLEHTARFKEYIEDRVMQALEGEGAVFVGFDDSTLNAAQQGI